MSGGGGGETHAPHSRKAGAHNFLVKEHGISSLKMVVAGAAAVSVLHFGYADPVLRAQAIRTACHYVPLIWGGAAFAIGWIEAPIKFQAPLLTRDAGLDVGRHVFSALNKLEIPAACLLTYAYLSRALPPTARALSLVPPACVALETAWLFPKLFSRARDIIAGKKVEKSGIHGLSAVLSLVKVVGLVALGVAVRK